MRNNDMYRSEHALAWLMAMFSVVLAVIGALEAFDRIDIGNSILSQGAATAPQSDAGFFADGALLLIPAIIAAFLALTLHSSEHHEVDDADVVVGRDTSQERSLAMTEHAGAYLMVLATIVLAVVGILVGFGVFDDNHTFYDGLTWLMLAITSSVLAATLHAVGHHMPVVLPEGYRTRQALEERGPRVPDPTMPETRTERRPESR